MIELGCYYTVKKQWYIVRLGLLRAALAVTLLTLATRTGSLPNLIEKGGSSERTYVGVHLQLAFPQCSLTGISTFNC